MGNSQVLGNTTLVFEYYQNCQFDYKIFPGGKHPDLQALFYLNMLDYIENMRHYN